MCDTCKDLMSGKINELEALEIYGDFLKNNPDDLHAQELNLIFDKIAMDILSVMRAKKDRERERPAFAAGKFNVERIQEELFTSS